SDVRRFDEILAPEFYSTNPDKLLVDRAAFLEQTAKPVAIKNLQAHDVKIRIMSDFAIIHAATSYTTPDGQQAHGRYTDGGAKQNGKWLAVSAHVTRCRPAVGQRSKSVSLIAISPAPRKIRFGRSSIPSWTSNLATHAAPRDEGRS